MDFSKAMKAYQEMFQPRRVDNSLLGIQGFKLGYHPRSDQEIAQWLSQNPNYGNGGWNRSYQDFLTGLPYQAR